MTKIRVCANQEDLQLVFGDELFEMDILNNDPWALAQLSNINILSNKELLASFVDMNFAGEGGVVVAAIFDAFDGESYDFDTVVHPKYQGKGLGTQLIEIAMDRFKSEILEMNPEATLHLDVVNPRMVDFLKSKYGLEVKEQIGGHILMGKLYRSSSVDNELTGKIIYVYELMYKYGILKVHAERGDLEEYAKLHFSRIERNLLELSNEILEVLVSAYSLWLEDPPYISETYEGDPKKLISNVSQCFEVLKSSMLSNDPEDKIYGLNYGFSMIHSYIPYILGISAFTLTKLSNGLYEDKWNNDLIKMGINV
jgi:ribosomal protein S18 acetylase RimI-like enzyme